LIEREKRIEMTTQRILISIEVLLSSLKHATSEEERVVIYKKIAALALNQVPSGTLDTELFNAVAEKTPLIAHEAVVLGRHPLTNRLFVYLTKRGDDEKAYPGKFHIPGSIHRNGETLKEVFERLSKEFGENVKIYDWEFVDEQIVKENGRCETLFDKVYLVKMGGIPTAANGKWYPVNKLPQSMVDFHQRLVIPAAVAAFKRAEARARHTKTEEDVAAKKFMMQVYAHHGLSTK